MKKSLALLLALAALSACGVKPGSLSPPPGAEDSVFPRTYPDPATSPKMHDSFDARARDSK